MTDQRSLAARRRFLLGSSALAASALSAMRARAARINPPALLDNEAGGYVVLPAGGVFCAGVLPMPDREIVHALVKPFIPLQDAWPFIEAYLKSQGLPVQALCGMELRIPQQLTFEGFRAFNAPYAEQLRKWNLILGNYSAVCRTNVVPALDTPKVPSVHAFSYCAPANGAGTTFCVSGTADIDARGKIVADGDVSPAGMRKRIEHCFEVISERLAMIELDWSAATHIDLCVVRDIPGLMEAVVVPGLQGAAARGVRVHFARPPIIGAEVELECRGVRRELVLGT